MIPKVNGMNVMMTTLLSMIKKLGDSHAIFAGHSLIESFMMTYV